MTELQALRLQLFSDATELFTGLSSTLDAGSKSAIVAFRRADQTPVYTCHWLEFWMECTERGKLGQRPDGILMLQDWGTKDTEGELLETAKQFITARTEKSPDTKAEHDLTVDNLFACGKWADAITTGRWLVMNAIWGLRTSGERCGYLGAPIHATAFLLWSQLVKHFSNASNPPLKLIAAGSWAVFDNAAMNSVNLTTYLDNWLAWALKILKKSPLASHPLLIDANFTSIKGTVYYAPHPAIWKIKQEWIDLKDGPPPK